MRNPPIVTIDVEAEPAWDALRRGEWESARAAFEALVASTGSTGEALEGLAFACYWLRDTAAVLDARQRAYQAYHAERDSRSAARVATYLATDFLEFRGEPAVAHGWLERARQLLDAEPPCVEHAWLKEVEAHLALGVHNDPVRAQAAAREARAIAHAFGETDYEMLACATEGLALVAGGQVTEGMRRLDAAAAAALGGEMEDLHAISITCCSMIQACERVRDFERAREWCGWFHELCSRLRLGAFLTFCRLQYGTVLLWRGEWQSAEAELVAAYEDAAGVKPGAQNAALVRLGELRRRQGRFTEAAELLDRARAHRLADLSRAALALDQGELAAAQELAADALRRAAGNEDAERAAALELLARAKIAAGAEADAAEAVSELDALAERIRTPSIRAAALCTAGLLARAAGDETAARQRLADAADLYEEGGSPFEAATTRVELARALKDTGRRGDARSEALAALSAFDRLGAAHYAGRVRELLQALERPDASTPAAAKPSPLTPRQIQVLQLVAQGLSNRDIAERLSLSEFTIRRHLANVYTRLGVSTRASAVAWALRAGLL